MNRVKNLDVALSSIVSRKYSHNLLGLRHFPLLVWGFMLFSPFCTALPSPNHKSRLSHGVSNIQCYYACYYIKDFCFSTYNTSIFFVLIYIYFLLLLLLDQGHLVFHIWDLAIKARSHTSKLLLSSLYHVRLNNLFTGEGNVSDR